MYAFTYQVIRVCIFVFKAAIFEPCVKDEKFVYIATDLTC